MTCSYFKNLRFFTRNKLLRASNWRLETFNVFVWLVSLPDSLVGKTLLAYNNANGEYRSVIRNNIRF